MEMLGGSFVTTAWDVLSFVTTAWDVLRLRMEKTAARYGG
jgi:hypothetical protein